MRTFNIKTFGCKVNQSDSEKINQLMIEAGLILVNAFDVDIFIINSCTVTKKASSQSKRLIKKIKQNNLKTKIVVTGCFVEDPSNEIFKIQDIDFIIKNKEKFSILKKLKNINDKKIKKNNKYNSLTNRIRPIIKVQDGCESFCSYCIIPYTRGKIKSVYEKKIFENIKFFDKNNYKEFILTGINLGEYGKDFNPKRKLYKLLYNITKKKYNSIKQVRISSIEPLNLSNKIIELIKNNKKKNINICEHFHIPLQSGDNNILRKMKRKYSTEYFFELINKILDNIPKACIGLDLIVGFPGETEKSFQKTYNFINNLKISYLHVFPFSPRKGTLAWDFNNNIKINKIKYRAKVMRKLSIKKRKIFLKKFLNQDFSVLVESRVHNEINKLKGLTKNYIPIYFNSKKNLCNTFQNIKIIKINENGIAQGILNN